MRNAETVLVVTEKRVQPQLGLENTGKPDDAKVSCPVWGGAEGKGLLTQYLASGLLHQRALWIPNYRERRIERQFIGSAHVEKANDLIVARRQKNRGMQWSAETSDALATLRTLLLNGG